MKEDKNSQRLPNNPFSRIPLNPINRLPNNPFSRLPNNPFSRISGSSGKFFEDFTAFKNTESKWNVKGFSKKIKWDFQKQSGCDSSKTESQPLFL